ncbi:hypothetical protein NBG84_07710 [Streptomyces sp. CWNU-1]|uniref:Uncharacterized protein n=1 Tax=Streptomyces albipurpureus TaxID=2897419 RepID=A0ABT0UHR4_9ACTN|nr:hypothetical protein [Streptomyces sp. CWNU-1]
MPGPAPGEPVSRTRWARTADVEASRTTARHTVALRQEATGKEQELHAEADGPWFAASKPPPDASEP